MSFSNLFILSIPIITASLAQIFFKKGIAAFGDLGFSFSELLRLIFGIFQNPRLFTGAILFGISFIFYLLALSRFQLNFAYPVMVSAGIIIIAFASWPLFGERLSWLQALGMILIIFGIFLLVSKR